jgi:hypothetical protein
MVGAIGQAVPACYQLWPELNVMYNGHASCCRSYAGLVSYFELDRRPDLFSCWNGDLFRQVRGEVVDGVPQDSGCHGFSAFKYAKPSDMKQLFYIEGGETGYSEALIENQKRPFENFVAGRKVVAPVPLRYNFNFVVSCIINCIMCDLAPERPCSLSSEAAFLKSDGLSRSAKSRCFAQDENGACHKDVFSYVRRDTWGAKPNQGWIG